MQNVKKKVNSIGDIWLAMHKLLRLVFEEHTVPCITTPQADEMQVHPQMDAYLQNFLFPTNMSVDTSSSTKHCMQTDMTAGHFGHIFQHLVE